MKKHTLYLSALCLSLLAGCSSTPDRNRLTEAEWLEARKFTYTPGELNGESVYDLLVAELAGHRKDYPLSLQKYVKQAQLTKDPQVIRRATRIAQYTRNTEELENLAKLWANENPESVEPSEILAGLYLHQGRFPEASLYLEKALTSDNPQVQLLIRSQAAKLPKAEATALLSQIKNQLKNTPDKAPLWLTRGIIEKYQVSPKRALKSFDQAIKLQSDYREAMTQKANLLKDTGQYDEALELIDYLLEKDNNNRQLQLLNIQTLYKAEQVKPALEVSQGLIESYPEETQLHLYLALLALDFNQLDESKQILQTVAKNKPEDTSPLFYLGLIAEQQKKNEIAVGYYLQVKHGNNIMQAITRMVGLFDSPSHVLEVNELIKQVSANNYELVPDIINLHADWLRNRVNKQAAIDRLEEGLSLYPEHLSLLYSRAMLRSAEELDQTESDFRFILEKQPDNALAMNALGYTLTIYSDRYDEAYELLVKAIELKPDDPAIIDSMGWVLFKLGRYTEAEPYLERAYELYPDPEVGSHLIQLKLRLNKRSYAKQLLDELLTKYPDDKHLKEASKAMNPK